MANFPVFGGGAGVNVGIEVLLVLQDVWNAAISASPAFRLLG